MKPNGLNFFYGAGEDIGQYSLLKLVEDIHRLQWRLDQCVRVMNRVTESQIFKQAPFVGYSEAFSDMHDVLKEEMRFR